jgi:hypothetical protein
MFIPPLIIVPTVRYTVASFHPASGFALASAFVAETGCADCYEDADVDYEIGHRLLGYGGRLGPVLGVEGKD